MAVSATTQSAVDSDCNSQKTFLERSNQLAPTTAAAATIQNKRKQLASTKTAAAT